MGGKTFYKQTPELLAAICEELAEGKSLRTICKQEGMPSVGVVCRWLSENRAFAEQYARAREAQADAIFDEILDIADDSSNDWIATESGDKFNAEAAARSRIRIDARKWMAGKMRPKVYGEKLDLEHSGSLAVETIKRVIVDPGTNNSDS
jgi:hypothetical protein